MVHVNKAVLLASKLTFLPTLVQLAKIKTVKFVKMICVEHVKLDLNYSKEK